MAHHGWVYLSSFRFSPIITLLNFFVSTFFILGGFGQQPAENCHLKNLEISNVGGHGIRVWQGDVKIEGCHIHHITGGGIKCSGDNVIVSKSNHIHHVGINYPSAIALWMEGKKTYAFQNKIHDTPYTAIYSIARHGRTEHNTIYRAMQELYDGGGIVIFGGKNIFVKCNLILESIKNYMYSESAIYIDENCEKFYVEDNLSLGNISPVYMHTAKNNTIRNNIFISGGTLQIRFPRSSNYVFEKNVILAGKTIKIFNPECPRIFKNNILCSGNKKIEDHKLNGYFSGLFKQVNSDNGCVLGHPSHLKFEDGRLSITDENISKSLGIKPIDISFIDQDFKHQILVPFIRKLTEKKIS